MSESNRKCERCPVGEGSPCAGEAGPWKGTACKVAAGGTDAALRWVRAKSEAVEAEDAAPADAPSPPAYPPLLEQAKSALKAALGFAASGFEVATQEEYDRRRSICLACPTGRYVPATDRCSACGCSCTAKPWIKVQSCPDGHW